jgi:hypothetical protein
MIIFSELQMQGEKHLNVNLGLLKILSINFPNYEIVVKCDSLHANKVRVHFNNNTSIKFETFNFTGERELKKRFTLFKVLREVFFAIKIFIIAKSKSVDFVVFTSAFPFTALFLNLFAYIFNIRIFICLHGDIGVLKLKNFKLTTWVFKLAINNFLLNRARNVVLIIYGESIKEELFRYLPNISRKNIITIDHPYNYSDRPRSFQSNAKTFSNIGAGIINKNTHYIFDLAKRFEKEISEKKLKFEIVGKVSSDVLSFKNDLVDIFTENQFISSDVFENKVETSDFFIYFFESNTIYDLSPSGTFFDAIKYNKPILSLKNPFFNHYFNRFGNIGYLCDDLIQMKEVIQNILDNFDINVYELQKRNLNLAKESLDISYISNSFKSQFVNINYEA